MVLYVRTNHGANTIKTIVKKILTCFKSQAKVGLADKNLANKSKTTNPKLTIIPRKSHQISRKMISENALKVLNRLKSGGFHAYLVGGGVRDLLLGREPKDFDIVTNATSQEIKQLFRNSRLIGKRFPIVHVVFHGDIIEVSSFKTPPGSSINSKDIKALLIQDATRRDFTVNAIYYDISNFNVIDAYNGIADLQLGILKTIGDPEERFCEDPVRMLRAVRLAAKLGFRIAEDCEKPMAKHRHLLNQASSARLYGEVLKLFHSGQALETFKLLRHYELFVYLFPLTEASLNTSNYELINRFISQLLDDTDLRVSQDKPVTPSYLVASLLWHPLLLRLEQFEADYPERIAAMHEISDEIIRKQCKHIDIPKYYCTAAQTIWELQERLKARKHQKLDGLVNHPRFRAGYDFLYLRARAGEGEEVKDLYDWWTHYYESTPEVRDTLAKTLRRQRTKYKPRRRKAPPAA